MSYNCWEVNIPREIYFAGHLICKNNHRNSHNLLNVVWQKKSLQHIFKIVYFPYLSQIHCWRLKLPPKTWLPELFLEWKKSFFFFFDILKVPWNSSACFTFSLSHIPSLAPCPVTVRLSKLPILQGLTGWTLEKGWLQWGVDRGENFNQKWIRLL